jgi:hypothetical protein
MEHVKRKNHPDPVRRYWRFFIPLAFVLCLMVKFPLRIVLGESFWDAMFYGTIVLICIGTAIHVYRRFGRRSHRFVAVALLCSVLAAWQIVDMTLLRYESRTIPGTSGVNVNAFEPFRDGSLWYKRHPREGQGSCYGTLERFIGNNFIAIVYDIDRYAVRMGCLG